MSQAVNAARERFSPHLLWSLVIVLILLAAGVAHLAGQAERQRRLGEIDLRLRTLTVARANMLSRALDDWRAEARFMALVPPVSGLARAALNNGFDAQEQSPDSLWRRRLEAIFTGFVMARPEVIRVRYVTADERATELVRVDSRDGQTQIVLDAPEPSVMDRTILDAATRLARSEVYVSDMALARTGDRVDLPRMPVIQVATPVFAPRGDLFGVIIISLDARRVLSHLSGDLNRDMRLYLMNKDEDFLVHPNPTRTFGFDLSNRHLWTDEFTLDAPHEGPAGMAGYRHEGGYLHAVRHRIALDDHAPDRFLTVAVGMPDSVVHESVQTIRLWVALVGMLFTAIISGFAAVWRLTERRGRVLRAQNDWLEAVLDGAHDAVIGLSLDGRITSWNAAATRLFGIDDDAAINATTIDLIVPPSMAGEERDILRQVARDASVPNLRTRRRRQDGQTIDVMITASPIRDGAHVAGVIMVVRDITEQVAAENNLRNMNSRLEQQVRDRTVEIETMASLRHAVLSSAGTAIIACDRSGTIILANQAVQPLLGYMPEELVAKATPFLFLNQAEVAARVAALDIQSGHPHIPTPSILIADQTDGHPIAQTWTCITKDGQAVPVLMAVAPLIDTGGETIGTVCTMLGLPPTPSIPTGTDGDLRDALDRAKAENRARATFLANMGQEIRVPLSSIIGSAHLIRHAALTEGQRQHLDAISRAGGALLTLVNDILDFARIEAGLLHLEPTAFRLTDAVMAVTDLFDKPLSHRNLSLDVDIDPSLPDRVIGDAGRIRQILDNLVANAVRFTHTGGITIRLERNGQSGELVSLRLIVRDTGPGMDPAQAAQLFQGPVVANRPHGGSGLGLALTYRLVQLMAGSIRAESQPGAGTSFTIDLSLPVAAASPPAPSLSGIAPAGLPDMSGLSGARVLLAEDNHLNQVVAKGFLDRAGVIATLVDDGAQAVKAVERERFDLILMDVQMPGMDGLEATRIIRTLPHGQHVPILAMSAGTQEKERQACIDAGMDDHVAKPFVPALFMASLRRWLAQGDPTMALASPSVTATDFPVEPIDGIDMAQAMGRVMGNRALLDTILDQFVNRFEAAGARLKEHLAAGRHELVARRLHELRGAAGNIAATALGERAALLELAILDGQAQDHQAEMDGLEAALTSQCHAIRQRTRLFAMSQTAPVALDLSALRQALMSRTLSAPDLLAAQRGALSRQLAPDTLATLTELVDTLRYADALHLLDSELPG